MSDRTIRTGFRDACGVSSAELLAAMGAEALIKVRNVCNAALALQDVRRDPLHTPVAGDVVALSGAYTPVFRRVVGVLTNEHGRERVRYIKDPWDRRRDAPVIECDLRAWRKWCAPEMKRVRVIRYAEKPEVCRLVALNEASRRHQEPTVTCREEAEVAQVIRKAYVRSGLGPGDDDPDPILDQLFYAVDAVSGGPDLECVACQRNMENGLVTRSDPGEVRAYANGLVDQAARIWGHDEDLEDLGNLEADLRKAVNDALSATNGEAA